MNQEFFETLAEKVALPIGLLGALGATVTLVAVVLAMLMFAPGAAGTPEGPPQYYGGSSAAE